MKGLMYKFALYLMICLLGCVTTFAQDAKSSKNSKGKYQNITVGDFDIKAGVNFPLSSLGVMRAEIIDELRKLNAFVQVSDESAAKEKSEAKTETSDVKTEAINPTLRLVGTVTKYKPGSRAKRYLIGFGAGMTKVVAHIKFIDSATGNVLFEKDVDGKVIIGFVGGESTGATRGLAKEVAKVAKKTFF